MKSILILVSLFAIGGFLSRKRTFYETREDFRIRPKTDNLPTP